MDKRITNASYTVEVDPRTQVPVGIRMTVLAGRKGATELNKTTIVGGEHVAFHFEYTLSAFDEVDPLRIPPQAQKLLMRRR